MSSTSKNLDVLAPKLTGPVISKVGSSNKKLAESTTLNHGPRFTGAPSSISWSESVPETVILESMGALYSYIKVHFFAHQVTPVKFCKTEN